MRKQIILFSLVFLLALPLIIAPLTDLGTFQDAKDIELRQLCDNCSFVNITSVVYPNGTAIVIGEVAMTKDGTEYSYTLDSAYTVPIGTYFVNGFGDNNGINVTWAYTLEVTQSGRDELNNFYLLCFIYLIGIFLFIAAFATKNHTFSFAAGAVFIIAGLSVMIYGIYSVADMYSRAVAFVTLGVGLYIFISSAYSFTEGND